MELNDTLARTKGIIFAGCSFTWGQGLWYYMNSSTVQEDTKYGYTAHLQQAQHHAFKESVRFPRLVARHFNTFELVHPQNGGANHQIIKYWTTALKTPTIKDTVPIRGHNFDYTSRSLDDMDIRTIEKDHPDMVDRPMPVDVSDISHLVFQITEWTRELDTLVYKGKHIDLTVSQTWEANQPYRPILLEKIEKENSNLGDYNNRLISKSIKNIKEFLQGLEEQGVKTSILSWPSEYLPYINIDPWLMERLIALDYNSNRYDCISELIKYNPELAIETDFENFKEPPPDGHPSLKCHRVIADNVIKFLEK